MAGCGAFRPVRAQPHERPLQLPAPRRAKLPALISRVPALLGRGPVVPRPSSAYAEFLPAHLEILETPASPKMGFMLWTICGMITAALAWSSLAKIDIYAEAQGASSRAGAPRSSNRSTSDACRRSASRTAPRSRPGTCSSRSIRRRARPTGLPPRRARITPRRNRPAHDRDRGRADRRRNPT